MRNLILASIILVSLSNLFGQALSIKDCVEIALVNKETLESAQLDVAAANKDKLGSYSNILPSLRFGGSWNETRSAGKEFNIDPLTGEVIDTRNSTVSIYTTWTSGLSLTQNIYDGGAWWNEIAKANNNYLIASQIERQVKINIIASVHAGYYQVLKDQQLLEVANLNLDLGKQQVELTQRKYELGAVNKTDLLKAEVLLGQARVGVVNQESALKNSMHELRNAMGVVKSASPFTLQDLENQNIIFQAETDALELMKLNNPGLLAIQAQIKGAELDYKLVRSARLPSLSASMSYSATANKFDELPDNFEDTYNINSGISLSFPLFTGFNLSTRSQQAKLALRKQKNEYTTNENDAYIQLMALLDVLQNYQSIIPINEEVLASATEDLKLVQERYSLGSSTILEVLDAQVSVIRARADLVASRYTAFTQQTYLKAQMGLLDQEY
ncbi:TolC family protein [Candidatus Neomarinimicrobiota bacterium]